MIFKFLYQMHSTINYIRDVKQSLKTRTLTEESMMNNILIRYNPFKDAQINSIDFFSVIQNVRLTYIRSAESQIE